MNNYAGGTGRGSWGIKELTFRSFYSWGGELIKGKSWWDGKTKWDEMGSIDE